MEVVAPSEDKPGLYLSPYQAVSAGPALEGAMPIRDMKKRLSATFESFSRRGSRDEAPVEDKCKMFGHALPLAQ